MNHIGIDPGVCGAIAVIYEGGRVQLWQSPALTIVIGGKNRHIPDWAMCAGVIRLIPEPRIATLEKLSTMQKGGLTGNFTMGGAYWGWQALLAGMSVPFRTIPPKEWQKHLRPGIPASDAAKDASRMVASQLFPLIAGQLTNKKDHDKAEALLLAEYGRRLDGRVGEAVPANNI